MRMRSLIVVVGGSVALAVPMPLAGAAASSMHGHIGSPNGGDPTTPGEQLWVARYNGPGNSGDVALTAAVSPDESKVFVSGYSIGSTGADDYATVAYDASTGSQLWVARYNGLGNDDDTPEDLGVSPDGSKVFVTGRSIGSMGSYDYATLAYDASTGATLWTRRYNGPAHLDDFANALAVSPDGSTVFVTGSSVGWGADDYATLAYDASTGATLWTRRYNGPGSSEDFAEDLGVSPDGSNVFITGGTCSTGFGNSCDYATVAYRASTGTTLWARRYNGPGNDYDQPWALGVSPDGSMVFATGYSIGSTLSYDYATVAYLASTGSQLWAARYDGSAHFDDIAVDLAVSPDGSKMFVTGRSQASMGNNEWATVAYDAYTGMTLWVVHYNGTGDAYARALGVSPDGSTVFVTGFRSTGPISSRDYATAAYGASTGSQLWARRYNGPSKGQDEAEALAVSPDGSTVFLTGTSTGSGSGLDYATVAYSTI